MVKAETERLLSATQTIGLSVSSAQIEQLVTYVDLLEKWNRTYNLTAIRSRREMFDRHLIESLSIAPFLSGQHRIDVGTGAGLPGLPLAIVEPDIDYVLLDSNGKKTRFLTEVKRSLGLSNITVETVRVETWQPKRLFDAVVTRAFAQRRKTLLNNFKGIFDAATLEALGIDPGARAETLTLDQFVALAEVAQPKL